MGADCNLGNIRIIRTTMPEKIQFAVTEGPVYRSKNSTHISAGDVTGY
jgi:hypothetical protein